MFFSADVPDAIKPDAVANLYVKGARFLYRRSGTLVPLCNGLEMDEVRELTWLKSEKQWVY